MSKTIREGFDKRKYVRIKKECVLSVDVYDPEKAHTEKADSATKGKTKNISAGGLFFEVVQQFDVGTVLHLKIDLPNWQRYKVHTAHTKYAYLATPLKVTGQVIRVEEVLGRSVYGIGVVLIGLDPKERDVLNKYIKDHT